MHASKAMSLLAAGAMIAGVASAAAPATASEARTRPLAADTLATLTVTATQADEPGYTQNSFKYPKSRPDLGSKANQWDWVYNRDFDKTTLKNENGNVTHGELRADPYSGQTIVYDGKAGAVDIEHIVARSEAWDSGASKWTQQKRDEFANDPLETMAVSASGNRSHGEKDAAKWLPSSGSPLFPNGNPSYDCKYVARQIAVKAKYGLTVDKAEHDAMSRTLTACPAQTIPLDTDGEYWDDNADAPATPLTGDTNGDGKYTAADLKGATAKANGTTVKGFDPTASDVWLVTPFSTVTLDGLPDGWTAAQGRPTGFDGVAFEIRSPENEKVATWTFRYQAAPATPSYSGDDLNGFRWTYEGRELEGEGTFDVPDPSAVSYTGLPDGWSVSSKAGRNGAVTYTVSSPDGSFSRLSVFRPSGKASAAASASPSGSTVEQAGGSLASTGASLSPAGPVLALLALVAGAATCRTRRDAR